MSPSEFIPPSQESDFPRESSGLPVPDGGSNPTGRPPTEDGLPTSESPADEVPPLWDTDGLPALARAGLLGRTRRRPRGKSLVLPADKPSPISPEQRIILLDTWQKSGLPAGDFAAMVGVSKHTLYAWKKRFDTHGPAGLLDRPKGGPKGSRLHELTKRTILMLKKANPDWGCQKISDMLTRGPALPASANAVARVLHEAGYELREVPTQPHPDKVRRFERAKPNQLWQTDLFTFVLKTAEPPRPSGRLHGRSQPLHRRLRPACQPVDGAGDGGAARRTRPPTARLEEILTDNGSQYVTWRGKSAFSKELDKRGIRQIVARPRHPQTLGKIERFWGTLWRECLASAIFLDLGDAQRRIGLFIDHHNFQRPHQGIDGLVPADRFFGDCLRGAAHAQGAGGGQRPGTGPSRPAQQSVLPDRTDGRSTLQRPCRGRARHPHRRCAAGRKSTWCRRRRRRPTRPGPNRSARREWCKRRRVGSTSPNRRRAPRRWTTACKRWAKRANSTRLLTMGREVTHEQLTH